MFNKRLRHKVGWLLTSSALGMVLSSSAQAGDARAIAKGNHYLVAHLTTAAVNVGKRMSAEDALQRGMKIIGNAKTPNDHVIAFEYLNYAASQGLPEAQFQCAIMYLDDQFAPGDEERAMSLLEKASEQGHKQAAIALSYITDARDGGFGC